MFKHLMLAVDGSRSAQNAAQHGIQLAKALGARVTALAVTVPWETQFARELAVVVPEVVVSKDDYDRNKSSYARSVLDLAAEAARIAGVPCSARHASHSRPHLAIVDTAAAQGCDLIVMGSRGHGGIAGLLLGSETAKVLSHSTICVLVHRQP
jgi:nucleotide-binding universal stress UspA family protein